LIRRRLGVAVSTDVPFGGCQRTNRRTALQIAPTTRFWCLRVSGAVAPSAPGRL